MPSFAAEAKSTWRKLFFPTKTFGNNQRFKWLYYDKENDKAYCFQCIKAIVQSGYDNWKKL